MLALALVIAPVEAEGKVDLVVLLDSSKSMFQYYNQVVDYVLTETVREYVRFGDSFHLLSFSDSTQLEIAQVLRTEPDLRSVIARLYLLYPLGRNTDLVTALRNVYQYVDDLPAGTTKHIILITDGMHSPAPGTPYSALDVPAVREEIDRAAGSIRERGWTMRIVRVPFTVATTPDATRFPATDSNGEAIPSSPGSGDYLADVAAAVGQEIQTFDPENQTASSQAGVDLHRITFPAELGTQNHSFNIQVEISNGSELLIPLELTGLILEDGTDILVKKAAAELLPGASTSLNLKVRLPDTLPSGPTRLSLEPRFKGGLRVRPARSVINLTLQQSILPVFLRNPGALSLFLLILIIACATILAVVLYIRRAHKKAEGPIVDAFLDSANHEHSGTDAGHQRQVGSTTNFAQPAHHTSPYATNTGLEAQSSNQKLIQQAAGNSRDSAMVQASKLSAAMASGVSTQRKLDLLNAASNRHHAIPEPLLAENSSSKGDMAQAASLLGTWKTPGSSRKKLPLVSDNPLRMTEGTRRPPMLYEPRVSRPGAVRLILQVRDQNPNIGKRNIRAMHAGGWASVGGGKSAFLIFLLPVPRNLAHLHYDGNDATLVPQKPEFFPDYNSPIESCIGKDIRVVTARGKELSIRFERYVAPLDKINKLLHCLETPGIMFDRSGVFTELEHEQEQIQPPELT